jgi:hypothetical protein
LISHEVNKPALTKSHGAVVKRGTISEATLDGKQMGAIKSYGSASGLRNVTAK